MTKEITKSIIMQQIQDKFKLRELEPEIFQFSEVVVPTYDILPHVQNHVADFVSVSITSATYFQFFDVPQNERWHLERYVVVFLASGAYKVTGVYVRRKRELTAYSTIYLDMTKGQTESYMHDLPKTVVLEPGDRIYVLVDDYTSTAYLSLYIDYIMEEVR